MEAGPLAEISILHQIFNEKQLEVFLGVGTLVTIINRGKAGNSEPKDILLRSKSH